MLFRSEIGVPPPAASLLLNEQVVGTGTASVSQVPYGENSVTWRLQGYPDETRPVVVDSCAVSKAEFTFDGTIRVGSGTHEVSCHWCEYGSASESVAVEPGAVAPVSSVLDRSGVRFAVGVHAGGAVFGPSLDRKSTRLNSVTL